MRALRNSRSSTRSSSRPHSGSALPARASHRSNRRRSPGPSRRLFATGCSRFFRHRCPGRAPYRRVARIATDLRSRSPARGSPLGWLSGIPLPIRRDCKAGLRFPGLPFHSVPVRQPRRPPGPPVILRQFQCPQGSSFNCTPNHVWGLTIHAGCLTIYDERNQRGDSRNLHLDKVFRGLHPGFLSRRSGYNTSPSGARVKAERVVLPAVPDGSSGCDGDACATRCHAFASH